MNAPGETQCSVAGCDKSGPFTKGLCRAHYMRVRRGKDLEAPLRTYAPGSICSIDDCNRPVNARGLCDMHVIRDRKYGDPNITKPPHWPAPPRGEQHHNWLGDAVSYDGAHWRVIRLRGSASMHTCTQCAQPAEDWAYNHEDPNPLTGPANGCLLEYSGNPKYYIPLCTPCHMAWDAAFRQSS